MLPVTSPVFYQSHIIKFFHIILHTAWLIRSFRSDNSSTPQQTFLLLPSLFGLSVSPYLFFVQTHFFPRTYSPHWNAICDYLFNLSISLYHARLRNNKIRANGILMVLYDIMDSEIICKTIEEVALRKYVVGDFKLGMLDKHGQRITIQVELPGRTAQGKPLSFCTGWMVYPDGKIVLTTPATDLSNK